MFLLFQVQECSVKSWPDNAKSNGCCHTLIFFFYCMKLICDAKYTLYNTGCTLTFQVHVSECWWGLFFGWLCTSITCGFIHFSVMNLQICIGIILICRCIIIQSNHEIKTCFTFFSLKIEQYSNKTISSITS